MIILFKNKLTMWANKLKRNIVALYIALSDHEVPTSAKILVFIVVGYALSPIDLIPDFIPILGFLDDLILLPLGIWFTVKLIPNTVMARIHLQAQSFLGERLNGDWKAPATILFIWLFVGLVIWRVMVK